MRTLIYARFSSDNQNSRSIDDQIADCRDRAEAEGWPIIDVFTDYAISGAAGMGEEQRPGMNALLDRLGQGDIQQVLVDSTSRYARNQGDGHHIRDQINFHGARLYTLSMGEIDAMRGAITGLLDEQQRKDLAHHIRRGQKGVVREGRAPAGLAFGYRRANRLDQKGDLIRGLREIDADEAATVLRIFTEYAGGASARAIALQLNREGVAGPRGSIWNASTIRGDRQRKNGLLRNRLYRGELVHNRTRKVVDPRTRRTLIRPNPESEWVSHQVDALRIVPVELFDRVQEQLAGRAIGDFRKQRRPKRLLSGLMECGICGGPFIVIGTSKWGCAKRREGSTCANRGTIENEMAENRVMRGLTEGMLNPDVVAAYVREYHRDFAKNVAAVTRDRGRLERAIAEATAKIDRLVDAIGRGADIEEVRDALAATKAERAAAQDALKDLEDLPIVALHPRIAEDYRARMEQLDVIRQQGDGADGEEVTSLLRALIERVRLTPRKGARGLDLVVDGRLASILALAAGQAMPEPQSMLVVERVKGIAQKHTMLRAKA